MSVPTSPDAELPSPYVICQVLPDCFLKLLDLLGSKMLCLALWRLLSVLLGSSVENT